MDRYAVINTWAQDGSLSDMGEAFFGKFGIEFPSLDLATVNDICQKPQANDPGANGGAMRVAKERYDVKPEQPMAADAWWLAIQLGLIKPQMVTRQEEFELAFVFGATRKGVVPRFLALFASGVRFKKIVVATGDRKINDEEKKVFSDAGLDPANKNEVDVSKLVFDQLMTAGVRPEPPPITYLATEKPVDATRPKTANTVIDLIPELEKVDSAVGVSHQPDGIRQALVFYRVLQEAGRQDLIDRLKIEFIIGAMTEQVRHTPSTILDAAGRVIWELSKLMPADFIEASARRFLVGT